MDFHLTFPVQSPPEKISLDQELVFMGSCFAENIGERMLAQKFRTLINPHGILYSPAAISTALLRYGSHTALRSEELFFAHGRWHSPEHHSRFSHSSADDCLSAINTSVTGAHAILKRAGWLFITYGSAFHYRRVSDGKIVGNCHKLPAAAFTKEMETVEEIVASQQEAFDRLKLLNPELKIVLTVSPVRYIRDGVVENMRSKSRLIEAAHQLAESNGHVHYFPAYELIQDDLRDYRFYEKDLVHPNDLAIDYVAENLEQAYFSEETMAAVAELNEIIAASAHRPFNANSDAHRNFRSHFLARCEAFKQKFPFLDLDAEMAVFGK